ncbi:thioredoxin-domain-containing protein [Coniophora puteana RWD-64-598 SS2]|uniref:Thioredoxin-domain-containing protein n=1 Tax=Coniophora puteana (strain RWD-64-598) TaxID=741705 RepID=A0A5M3MS59_CONPW|nr:thioredoxin-domain-containing protein [Coniophora puteana RWD-64-598 SS2]EIW81988.1 thioredoxin-domain-containing protein [Coniophora puteana RWD-64-598 SS2]
MRGLSSFLSLPSALSALVAVLALQAAAAPVAANTILTPANFKDTIANGVWFVEHFSPYCPHCRHFAPTWDTLVQHYASELDPGVSLAQVDCSLNGDLCADNGIKGYPQLNLYKDGQFVKTYRKDRELNLLVEFLDGYAEQTGSPDELAIVIPPTDTPAADTAAVPESDPVPASSAAAEADGAVAPTSTLPPAVRVQTPQGRSNANPKGEVVALTPATFDAFRAQGPMFVKFYAPWCGHCKKLAPTWVQLARHEQGVMNVAEVNCEENKALCAREKVEMFPVIKFYAGGVVTDYAGGRGYQQLVAFADKAGKPSMVPVSAEELAAHVAEEPVVYLFLHKGTDQDALDTVAQESQSLFGNPRVFTSTDASLFAHYGLPPAAPWALVAFADGDAAPVATFAPSYGSSSTQTAGVAAWLQAHRLPSALELSKDTFAGVMRAPQKPLVVLAAVPAGQEEEVRQRVVELGKKWRAKRKYAGGDGEVEGQGQRDVVFAWMKFEEGEKWLKGMYGLKPGAEAGVVITDHSKMLYYDVDMSGDKLALQSAVLFPVIDAVMEGALPPKHSENRIERFIRFLNDQMIALEFAVVHHPYWTALFGLGFVVFLVSMLRRLFNEDLGHPRDYHRLGKEGRLD